MKLFLAGANDKRKCEIIYNSNHPYLLSTFFVHQNGFNKDWIYWYNKTSKRGASWIMDSGLFTMMFGAGSNKTYTEKDLLEYTYKYLNNLKKIKYKDYIVEMDVHKVLGLQALKKFRKIFEEQYPLKKTIFVWHVEEKEEGFRELCKKYPYIAISIPELRIVLKGRRTLKNAVKHLIKVANDINPNIKIHLLGCNDINILSQKGYYSCDASDWISTSRWKNGGTIWVGKKYKRMTIHTRLWKRYFKENKYKIMSEKLANKLYKTEKMKESYLNLGVNILSFTRMNQYINNRFFNYEKVKKLKDEN
tara:strand:+ start:647 stop:1561 length:915 start_codon:yes stop_codon:yes gene_type:complete